VIFVDKNLCPQMPGPTLTLDPEVFVLREAFNVEATARACFDLVIDVWAGRWESDEEMQAPRFYCAGNA
jgi:hypothetical protein